MIIKKVVYVYQSISAHMQLENHKLKEGIRNYIIMTTTIKHLLTVPSMEQNGKSRILKISIQHIT